MIDNVIDTFALVVQYGVPYALTWRIGIYIVNTLLDWITGRNDKL